MMNKIQTKYCSKCGRPINPQEKFCVNCGYKIGNDSSEQKENKLKKKIANHALLLFFSFSIVLIIIISLYILIFSNARLPQVVRSLYSNTSITEFSKARYPEKFVWGLGGWLRNADEIWCVSYSYDDWPYGGSDLAVRVGGDWDRYTVYDSMWKMVGCRHEYKQITKNDDLFATVTHKSWERSLAIEAFTEVSRSDWWDQIPDSAEIQSCSQKYRYTSEIPEANATEVCSEAVVKDTGTGIGEVVQECVYEVYDDYCDYTTMDWVVLTTVIETGENSIPVWPEPNLSADQQLGAATETYTIIFSGDGERYSYTTTDVGTFLMAQPGSEWELTVNQLGAVQSIEPSY